MTIGILGAGQLGQMLAQAGIALGQDCVFLDPAEAPCAAVMGDHLSADYDDADALAQLARRSDVVTLEFENVPVATLDTLAQSVPVHPGSRSLACAQDRAEEKALFDRLGIATPTYRLVDSADALREALRDVGAPAVLKNRRFGYDGKGQSVLKSTDDVDAAWDAVGGQPSILEAFVPFQREVSMVAARATDGAMRFYPVTENVHRDGILRLSTPQQDDPLTDAARQATRAVAEALDHVGVLAFEFFDRDGELVANEFAPRVHNSGHWTQDGAVRVRSAVGRHASDPGLCHGQHHRPGRSRGRPVGHRWRLRAQLRQGAAPRAQGGACECGRSGCRHPDPALAGRSRRLDLRPAAAG